MPQSQRWQITLQLDAQLKQALSDLFFASAQTPSTALQSRPLTEDGLAIFRVAKEFALSQDALESHAVDTEDVARLLRFASWLLTYGGELPGSPEDERSRNLRSLFASVSLQAQSQFPGFEALLRSFGIERQLVPWVVRNRPRHSRRASASSSAESTSASLGMSLERKERTQQVQIQVNAGGASLTSTTTESTWSAGGFKQTSSSK